MFPVSQKLVKDALYHPKESLIPRTVLEGVWMWSVALERTMLTCFLIEPESCFDMHSHAAEQITLVLDGELFFKVNDRIIGVKKGEVIAIPTNVPHAVFTKKSSVIAVDAWSPVIEKYQNEEKHTQETDIRLAGCPGMKP